MTNSYGDAVLYLDYRDSRCGYYTNTFGHPIDIWIKYNIDNDSYQISSNNGTTWVDVLEHQKLNIWGIKQVGSPITYNFPDYTENNLAVYSPLTKAKLFWEAPPPQDCLPSKHRIWYAWSLVGTYQDPEPDDYYWISDIDDAFLSFTDEAIIEQNFIETASHTSYYYIEAFNGTQSLYASNIVNVLSNTDWTKTLKITNDNNHPRIAWAPYNVGDYYSDYNYKVYRKVETIPPRRPPAVYQEIFETGYGYPIKLEYTDYDFTMGGSSNIASYYVKATADLFVSNASNIVSSNVLYYKRTDELLPEKYSLEQNYPNPFNPATLIIFSIPNDEFVSLRIYDVLGREVAQIINERRSAGTHQVEFDGASLNSGVYYYTLTAGSYTETKKMLMVK